MSQKKRKSISELTDTEKIYWGKVAIGALTGVLMGIIGLQNGLGWLTLFGILYISSYVLGNVFPADDLTMSKKLKTAMFSYTLQVIFWWILLFNFFYTKECTVCI
ncbi:MAG: hypothetical protein ACTSYA_06775 [Candidatus Kariarchaeaceae archaeon]